MLEVVCYQEKEKNCPELDFFAEHVNFGVKDEKVIEFFGPEKFKKMMTLKKIWNFFARIHDPQISNQIDAAVSARRIHLL